MSGKSFVIQASSVDSDNIYQSTYDVQVTHDGAGHQNLWNPSKEHWDTGNYRIHGNQFCTRWKVIRAGAERCLIIYRRTDGTYEYWTLKGELEGTFKIVSRSS